MKDRPFRVGECVTTPRGFVAEIARLSPDCALIRFLGKQRHLGEMAMQLALLRPATVYDLALAGIRNGDPSAPGMRVRRAKLIEETPSGPRPHRAVDARPRVAAPPLKAPEYGGGRSKRNSLPGLGLHELVASLMNAHH